MVEKMAINIVGQMADQRIINDEKKDYYVYAIICLVERFITIGTILLIGTLGKMIVPTILFLIFFLSLRKRTGGFHADAFWQCYMGTVGIYIMILYTHSFLSMYPDVMYGALILSICIIGIIGAVNHPNMDMNAGEMRETKKAARLIVLLEGCIIYFTVLIGMDIVLTSFMSIAVILCAILLCLAKILKQEVRKNEENQ